jgi:pSer/pThr/pTyr-binding forkhead associated (FHA) protein
MATNSDSTVRPHGKGPGLVIIYGDELGRMYDLGAPSMVIGRSSKCEICISQESISRHHSKIVNTGRSVVIRDIGSSNGTHVNDEPIEERVLRDGDLIKVGRTIFKFLAAGNIERAYHEELYRRVLANQTPREVPAAGERSKTTTRTLTEPKNGNGEGGSDDPA